METKNDTTIENRAKKNISDILNTCFKHDNTKKTLIVYDTHFGLTDILTSAYKKILPSSTFLDFDSKNREEIIDIFNSLHEGDMVVLIQSTNFLLNEFRIRLHLFNKNLKVIEHMHLARNDESMWSTYVDSLEYDTNWYPIVAPKLKKVLDNSKNLIISGLDATLTINGELESAKLNIGDYTGMTNVGGTFPIGEVFTEAKDFASMNGSFYVYAYADSNFNVQMHTPFKLTVVNGIVTEYDESTPTEFIKILELVKSFERPLIREIGFGLNKAISKEHPLSDITAFERILGMHFSLGEKHSVYKKEGLTTNKTKFHIDLFPVVDSVTADSTLVFENGKYIV
jgi:hypothetical protein